MADQVEAGGGVWVGAMPIFTLAVGAQAIFMPEPTPSERADKLLKENCAPGCWVLPDSSISVRGGCSGAHYQLVKASPTRVYVYLLSEQQDQNAMFCVYSLESAQNAIPWQDEMLLLSLYLQYDEAHFLRTAVMHVPNVPIARIYNEARKKAGLPYDARWVEAQAPAPGTGG